MNAEILKKLDTFLAFTAKLALEGFRDNENRLSTRQYTRILLRNREPLLSVYGDDLICFTSPHLLKEHTKKTKTISPQTFLDFGEDFIVPDYFTVTDEMGDIYRLEVTVSNFEDWEKHNQLVKQKADETYIKYQQLEKSRLYMLSLVKGNKKARVSDAIRIANRRVTAPEPEPEEDLV